MRQSIILAVAILFTALQANANWPFFRGPDLNGVIEDIKMPASWGESSNVLWKIDIHDRGWSSPVVHGDQIWLTTATPDGTKLYGICVDAVTGRTLFDQLLFEVTDPQFAHKFNSYASPTAAIEKDRVYLSFGSPGIACINTTSFDVIWTREDIKCDHFRGAGSSLVIFNDLLITHFDGADHQFVMAFDKYNGETKWRTKRSIDFKDLDSKGNPAGDGDFRKAYSTPYIFKEKSGDWVMASLGSKAGYGYSPSTGEELWRVEDRSAHSGTSMPVVGEGLLFYVSGFARGTLYSIPLGSRGVISNEDIKWKTKRNVSNKPSPLYHEGFIYMVDDGGIASCLDVKNGEEKWRERVGGNFSASPLINNGKIFFFNEEGVTSVLKTGPEYKEIGKNILGSGFMATPAVFGNDWILRSKTHLYRISTR